MIPLEEYDLSDIFKFLEVAQEFSLQELVSYLQSFLIENKEKWMGKDFYLVYQESLKHNSFFELRQLCTDTITNEPERIFESSDFISIPEKSLIYIIQNDNLQISEVQIWEYVLKWGLAQNPELPSDHKSFSKDDFKTLKNTLQQCIPFIRFTNLTAKEFMEKVMPYGKICQKNYMKIY